MFKIKGPLTRLFRCTNNLPIEAYLRVVREAPPAGDCLKWYGTHFLFLNQKVTIQSKTSATYG